MREAVARVTAGEGFAVLELSVVLADHRAVRALNAEWLGHDYETDVLSFALDDEAAGRREIDGEVYVDLDTAAERAPEFGVPFEPASRGWITKDRSAAGHIGDPRHATAEKGETIFSTFANDVVQMPERVLKWDGKSWSG